MPVPLSGGQHLNKGIFEDFVIYICSHQSFFTCIYSPKYSPFSRSKRRQVFIVKHALAFFCMNFSFSFFLLLGVSIDSYLLPVFNVIVIRPLSSSFAKALELILTCPCLLDSPFREKHVRVSWVLSFLGKNLAALFIISLLGLLG